MPEPLLAALCVVALVLPSAAGLITIILIRDARRRMVAVAVVWTIAVGVAANIIATSIFSHPEWYTSETPSIVIVIFAIIGDGVAVAKTLPLLTKSLAEDNAGRLLSAKTRKTTYRR